MADKRAYAKMDIGYLDNPKMLDVLEESHTAVLMHAASILYSAQHLTDGVVPVKLMQRKVGGSQGDVDLLSEVGLWHQQGHNCAECLDPPERSVVVHNYLEHNRSEAEANRLSKAGAKGAKARWANAPIESESDSGSHANRIADRNGHPNATRNANPNGQRERKRDPSKEGGVGETEGFEEWWSLYPRKIGKGQARKAFRSALKKTDISSLVSGVEAYAESVAGKDQQYIAHPATWLNGERWDDEPPSSDPEWPRHPDAPDNRTVFELSDEEYAERERIHRERLQAKREAAAAGGG